MSLVVPNLYIGDMKKSEDFIWLEQNKINGIVDCAFKKPFYPENFNYLNIPLIDDPYYGDLSKVLENSYNFINDHIEKGHSVLVHCRLGISRSSSIICYYLMKKFNMTFKEALEFLRKRHSQANPNDGFQMQLAKFSFSGRQ